MMEQTSLTVGGFTQPAVVRSLIELPSNIEKGFTQGFFGSSLNLVTLELVNEEFTTALGMHVICVVPNTWYT